tara:strand:+ start:445 stop:744 length:300 start_codon:yes stop_codon:yes gene_type:complete
MENVKTVKDKESCYDCGKEIYIKDNKIKDGLYLAYKQGDKKIKIFKCKSCFKRSPMLKNFRKCEVYSRVVGYIRPVQQWHIGKRQEFKERKEFSASCPA